MVKKVSLLIQDNDKRSIHSNLFAFIISVFERFTCIETVCRKESMKLWESLIGGMPIKNIENMPNKPDLWIQYYIKKSGQRSIFKKLHLVSFEEEKKGTSKE